MMNSILANQTERCSGKKSIFLNPTQCLKSILGPMGILLALGLWSPPLNADVRLPAIISNNMVLQADFPSKIWGKADPSESVEVDFSGQSLKTQADAKGAWVVELAPMKASSENLLLVVSGNNRIEVNNVLVGEVWLGSGQSNMEWSIGRSLDPELVSANADFPAIRHFEVRKNIASQPTDDCEGQWVVCSPKTVKGFSAVLYHFGRNLHSARQFPVGLIHASMGGSYIRAWMSKEALDHKAFSARTNFAKEFANLKEYKQFRLEEFGRIAPPDTSTWDETWAQPSTSTADWKEVQMPQTLEKAFADSFDGVSWVRREFVVPEKWAGKEIRVQLPQMSSGAVIYWNGEKLSSVSAIPTLHQPSAQIPAKHVNPGSNLLAIRFYDPLGTGGPQVEKDMYLQGPSGERLTLEGKWLGKIERRLPLSKTDLLPPLHYGVPSGHYNAMISPLSDYRCRGVLWYQGESDSGNPHYGAMLEAMIQSWRKERNDPALAFLWVQLPNFGQCSPKPIDHIWGRMRQLQSQPLKLPNTGMVVTIDSKQPELWHPTDKRYIGERLSLLARNSVYGEKELEASGPRLESVAIYNGGLRLNFSSMSGLQLNEGEPNGFALSADGKSYHWANAQLDGCQIQLSSAKVAAPRFVRYAWDINPYVCLFSKSGLPAAPFEAEAKE